MVQLANSKLVLHCGAQEVDRAAVTAVHTPDATRSWQPIPHIDLIQQIEVALEAAQLKMIAQVHSLTRDGARYFGLMQIEYGTPNLHYAWVLGLRNSHDKSYPAGLVAGSRVFVCDNLSFSGEVSLFRKHTVFIKRDLPQLTARAVGQLQQRWAHQDQRIEAYRKAELDAPRAHDLLIRALDVRAIAPTRLPDVVKEWREPRYEEFAPRTLWSLFNCFTEVLKDSSLAELPRRTEALHGLFDGYANVPMLTDTDSAN